MARRGATASWTLESAILLPSAIALFPFYIFPSGGIQPTHLVFLLMAAIALFSYDIPWRQWATLLLCFSIYTLIIEYYYGVLYDDMRFLINPVFSFFNFLLSVSVYQIVLRKGAGGLKIGILAAAAFATISVYIGGVDFYELGDGGRGAGTFNNPNQLGYFSVCLLSLSYLLYRQGDIRFPILLALLAASLYLAIASLSKAAMIANFVVVAFALRSSAAGRGMAVWLGLVIVVLGGATYLLLSGYFDDFLFYDRIINLASESDSSLEERGYFAFLDAGVWQVIPGIGSSEVYRIVGHEIHSTFASVLNTYGVIGFAMFGAIFVIWGRTIYQAYGATAVIALLGPAILYGMTHNGVRFSIFWLLFSASMALARRKLWIKAAWSRPGGGAHSTPIYSAGVRRGDVHGGISG